MYECTFSQNNIIQYLRSNLFSCSSVNPMEVLTYIVFYLQLWEPAAGESGSDSAAPVIVEQLSLVNINESMNELKYLNCVTLTKRSTFVHIRIVFS